MAWVLWWCMAWKWKHLSYLWAAAVHRRIGARFVRARVPGRVRISLRFAQEHFSSTHGKTKLLTGFQLFWSKKLASWCWSRSLQVYKPGQWHSAARAPIYSAPGFYEWNGPYHSACGELLWRTCEENGVFCAHLCLLLFNPFSAKICFH